jgi:hypothetical protein
MVKFKKLNGYTPKSAMFISITIEGGDSNNSIGDQVWFSDCGTELHVFDEPDPEVMDELLDLFEPASRAAFRGAMLRMGVEIGGKTAED